MDITLNRSIAHPFSDYAVQLNSMTTSVEIVAGKNKDLAIEGSVYLKSLVKKLNRFDPSSEWSLMHQKKETWITVSPEIIDLLCLCKQIEREFNNEFRLDYEGLDQTLVDGVGRTTQGFGEQLKQVQTGRLQNYMLFALIGVILILVFQAV